MESCGTGRRAMQGKQDEADVATLTDEQQLIAQLREPSQRRKAFERVVSLYAEKIYWQIRRIVLNHDDADDVLQNAMLKAWTSIDTFHGDSRIFTWLSRIAINEALDHTRRQQRRQTLSSDAEASAFASQLQADTYFSGDDTDALLQQAIAQLPEKQRTVFLLRYYDELKYSELSSMLHTSEGALKASYHLAVKKITDFFRLHD